MNRNALREGSLTTALVLLLMLSLAQPGLAQTNQLTIFTNYFVTGDYVVSGWVKQAPDFSGYATGTVTFPDPVQAAFVQPGTATQVPPGADVVAAFLYWSTVESSMSAHAGQTAFFNGNQISGLELGNPNAPVSWSNGGCAGSANGSKTMRTYRADVREYLPLDTNPNSATFGRTAPNTSYTVRLADSGSNGNAAPIALGASMVLVYRVLNGNAPLNGITIFDGIYAPSNSSATASQNLYGLYQAANIPTAKLTHIVANGQPNKIENVYLNTLSEPLPSLYGTLPPFPGKYSNYGSQWDNPTWVLSSYQGYVNAGDASETTQVVPNQNNAGCVTWGAMILSATVQASDGDGLIDAWKTGFGGVPGYTDAVSNQWVSLPGATKGQKDLFVELDYLSNMDGKAGNYLHSHVPKQDALDKAGKVLADEGIHVHFDLGAGIYANDATPYIIKYPVALPNPLPPGTLAPQAGVGGNSISESALVCTDGNPAGTVCAYPSIPTIGWKGGFVLTRDTVTQPITGLPLGNFQPGRGQSYHYVLVGHALGASRSFWSTLASALTGPNPLSPNINVSNLGSIAVTGTTSSGTGTVTLYSPPGLVKPGDCPNVAIGACGDANNNRVSISGVIGQQNLNGNYIFSNAVSQPAVNGVTKTTFTIATFGVVPATYNFTNEPQLAVNYLGPTSTSGHSDFGGGGDSALTFGLWQADDPANCQADASQPLLAGQLYCNNQIGTVQVQEGTLLHELGHTLTLTHGGAFYLDAQNPTVATYGQNCNSNFLSVMNYLFQVRGFGDMDPSSTTGNFDFSGTALANLSETGLNEQTGIGSAAHFTRWFGPPSPLDTMLNGVTGTGTRFASRHCDGTPITDGAHMVRVDGNTLGTNVDWNNDGTIEVANVATQDENFNGIVGEPQLPSFNDSANIDLTQIGARGGPAGFSGGGGGFLSQGGGGFLSQGGGGFLSQGGGGFLSQGGGGFLSQGGGGFLSQGGGGFLSQGGGGFLSQGGGIEQDSDIANSTSDPPTGLSGVVTNNNNVILTWFPPSFGQVRSYSVWRALGQFPTFASVITNSSAFTIQKTLTGTPPATTYTDTKVKPKNFYTYFVTETNKPGIQSAPSVPLVIFIN